MIFVTADIIDWDSKVVGSYMCRSVHAFPLFIHRYISSCNGSVCQ